MKIIRTGNQTAFSAPSILEPFDYAISNGFDAFEWFPDKHDSGAGWEESDIDSETRVIIKEKSIAADMGLTVHAPWQANPLNPESESVLDRQIEFAEDIGATLLNIHFHLEEGIEAYARSIEPLIDKTAKAGIRLSIENTPITSPEDFNALFAMIRSMNNASVSHVGMCLDLGHANLCDSSKNDYLGFIKRLDSGVPVIHIHLHENYGDHDSHLTIFTGPSRENDAGIYGFIKLLKKRKFEGAIIMEQWPDPPSLLNQARERLYKMFDHKGLKHFVKEKPLKEKKREPHHADSPNMSKTSKIEIRDKAKKEDQTPPKPKRKTVRYDGKMPVPKKGDDFVDTISEADGHYRSWREKLNWINALFGDDSFVPDKEQLIYISIYLRFLNTGEIPCTEDGRHFRPCHHARMSQEIHGRLIELTTEDNAYIIRKIYPLLPSYDSAYTRAEPLTRIRDIAHRNDIPKDLKNEIKHTLQNKLHRCAGPEDLITSKTILKRITSPGADYSSTFVEQFKIFHRELKEFFNAGSSEEILKSLTDKGGVKESEKISEFLTVKSKLGTGKKDAQIDDLVKAIEILTDVRTAFVSETEGRASAEAQKIITADIGLEDFAFVTLSRFINELEKGRVTPKSPPYWLYSLKMLSLSLKNLELSCIFREESVVTQSELNRWMSSFNHETHDDLLRIKAGVERCKRIADDYSNNILNLFLEKAQRLGKSLSVPGHAVDVYCEGDIRGNLVFQMSRLISHLLKSIRDAAGLPPWDAIVTGKTQGRLVFAEKLRDIKGSFDERTVLLLRFADGDEEIKRGTAGIILGHEIPHLSHLAVRARQEGAVFVVCEDRENFDGLKEFVGKNVILDVRPDSASIKLSAPADDHKDNNDTKNISYISSKSYSSIVPEISLTPSKRLYTLAETDIEGGGGKACGARKLEELSKSSSTGFKTPSSLTIPFGVLEEALSSSPVINEEYSKLLSNVDNSNGDNLDNVISELQKTIEKLPVDNEIISGINDMFSQNERLMVRSSSNCEDLEDISGAGLYDSIANVPPSEVKEAILKVWASLWTRRAVISRREAGIDHRRAHMAILIQRMVIPDISFIMHTVNPLTKNNDEIFIELAPGLGETLASASAKGVPYRMICLKSTGKTTMHSFANYSYSILPSDKGGLLYKRTDYSNIPLSVDAESRNRTGASLAAIGKEVEVFFGSPQDIEGAIAGDDIYLLQSRPQQGL